MTDIFRNKNLRELTILSQSYFKASSKLNEEQDIRQAKENKTLEKLTMGLGVMKTIKPLIKCLCIFTRLKELRVVNVELSKLHFQVIDNYLISNPHLQKLVLSNVKLGYDHFMLLAGTIRNSKRLRSLNLSSNLLRSQGCTEVANVLVSNTSLKSLNLDNNEIKEPGLVALLKVLE